MTLSGDILGEREIYLPLVSPSSPDMGLAERDGEREIYLPSELTEEDRDREPRRRRSGEEPRDEGGVREGVRDRPLPRLGSSSSCPSAGIDGREGDGPIMIFSVVVPLSLPRLIVELNEGG